ncbi:MAG: hypothetical protein ACLFVB_02970 [Thermoplasmata archaeon]
MRRMGIKKCRMQDSEEGVATTVGTIMALLIFLSIFSLITQQYVPVWMEDNEAYHMDEVKSQFAQMKGNIDSLILNNYKNYPTYTSIKLGSEGIPMFAEETYGIISLESSWGDTDKGMSISFSNNDNDYSFSASGNISINVLNRYFDQQSLIYEYGAIILKQGDDSLLRASPPISVNEVGDDRYNIQISIIDLVGDDSRHGGAGSVGVTAKLLSRSRSTFSSIDDNFTFSLDTEYPQAWANWFNESTDLNITTNGNLVEIDLGPNNISEIQVTSSKVEVDIQG